MKLTFKKEDPGTRRRYPLSRRFLLLLGASLCQTGVSLANSVDHSTKIKILLSSFEAFGSTQCAISHKNICRTTNMSQMVVATIKEKIATDTFLSQNSEFDFIELPVSLTQASLDLSEKIKGYSTPPHFVIAFGESEKHDDVVLETIARNQQMPINTQGDIVSYVKTEIFRQFEEALGLNLPSHEMYCALDKESRRKIMISTDIGNHACNSTSYQMIQALRPKIDGADFTKKFVANLQATLVNLKTDLEKERQVAIDQERKRIADFNANEAKQEIARNLEIAKIKEKNEKIMAKMPLNKGKDRSEDGTTDPAAGLLAVPTPYLKRTTFDNTSSIEFRFDQKMADLTKSYNEEIATFKSQRARVIGTLAPSKFTFVHVPKSFGQSFLPEYALEGAVEVLSNQVAPNTASVAAAGGRYYEAIDAARLLKISEKELRSKAKNFLTAHHQIQEKAKDDSPVLAKRTLYLLSEKVSQSESSEQSLVLNLAQKIIAMLHGLVESARLATPLGWPLPAIDNNARYPLTKQESSMVLAKLKDISKGKIDATERTIDQGTNKNQSGDRQINLSNRSQEQIKCYMEFLKRQFGDK